jgi:hypothetical protein
VCIKHGMVHPGSAVGGHMMSPDSRVDLRKRAWGW